MKGLWAVLVERNVNSHTVMSLLDVSVHARHENILRINTHYRRVDDARNMITRMFWEYFKGDEHDDAVVVMLDNDHVYPHDIVPRLVSRCDAEHEVVGALAFRRSKPHDPCFYRLNEQGHASDIPLSFDGSLVKCDIVGTGAIAIRKSALRKLRDAGFDWPWFRFIYQPGIENMIQRTEDWNFGLECRKIGVSHWCDTSIVIPHITEDMIVEDHWFREISWGAEHPEDFSKRYAQLGMKISPKEEVE
jgi:hypothetical protein